MTYRLLALLGVAAVFECLRSVLDRMFDRGWSHGWEEGFACGISAAPEDVEKVFPSADMEDA